VMKRGVLGLVVLGTTVVMLPTRRRTPTRARAASRSTSSHGRPITRLACHARRDRMSARLRWRSRAGRDRRPRRGHGQRGDPRRGGGARRKGYRIFDGGGPAVGPFPADQVVWRRGWLDWLLFLRGAVDHGGVLVN
jgi:hypothetical protein